MPLAKHWSALLEDYIIDAAWSPDGSLLAAAAQSGSITLYEAKTGAVKHALAGHEDGTNCLAWLPATPSILASGGQDGCVRFWDATSGQQIAETKPGSGWVEHLAWSPLSGTDSGAILFAAAGRKLVALRPDGTVAHTFADAPKTISALTVSPVLGARPSTLKSSAVAAACFGQAVVWDATNFAGVRNFPYGNAIYALTWSPDGRWLVAGCHDNAVHLWAPAEEGMELNMSGYETRLKELSFSADSKWLATGGGRDCCVWDCSGRGGPEGREPLALPHGNRVCAVAFQHAHGLLATGATDGVFTLWEPAKKSPLLAEARLPASVTKFAWSPDDTLLAAGTEKGALFVFKT